MKAHKTSLKIFFNNKKQNKMAQTIDAGQTLPGRSVLWDTVTDQEEPTVFWSDRSATSSDESIATAEPASDHAYFNYNGIATGTATITITEKANYTNSNGAPVSETKIIAVPIVVPGAANATEGRVQF